MVKKVPHLLDTEELLKRVTASEPVQDNPTSLDEIVFENQPNDILSFLSVFNIVNGEERIKKITIYNIYKAWSMSPLPKSSFHQELSKYIPIDPGRSSYYSINQNAIKLTYDAYRDFKRTRSKAKSKAWVLRLEDFLNYHAIKDGPYWIEIDILYFLYDKFEHERGNTHHGQRLSKKYFEKITDIYLKSKTTEKSKLYAVSDNIKNFFQPGQLERMKKTYAIQEKQKHKKKKQKKQSGSSRARS